MRTRTVRAGLFLLFAVLVAVVVPIQPALSADIALRTNPAEIKSEIKEHRDSEKLRQRPAYGTPARREARNPDPGAPVPAGLRGADAYRAPQPRPAANSARWRSKPPDDSVRSRHAPATLQVYRH